MSQNLQTQNLCKQCVDIGVPDLLTTEIIEGAHFRPHDFETMSDTTTSPGLWARLGTNSEKTVRLGLATEIRGRRSCPFCEMVDHVLIPELFRPPHETRAIYAERNREKPSYGSLEPARHHSNSDESPKIYITVEGGAFTRIVVAEFGFKTLAEGEKDVWVTSRDDRMDKFPDRAHMTSVEQANTILHAMDTIRHGDKPSKRGIIEDVWKSRIADLGQVDTSPILEAASRCLDEWESIPERTIETFQTPLAFDIMLIDVKESCLVNKTTAETYLALSYVWGGDQKAKLYTHNRQALQTSKALDTLQLSQVVKDAMEFTVNLGHSFLWVDALCIEQNEDSQQKKEQLRIMDKIYQSSYVTLVAWTVTSSNSPLPGVGSTQLRPQVMIRTISLPSDVGQLPVILKNRLSRDLKHITGHGAFFHYDTRAWTLQERLLSERCLLFHHRDTIFCFKNHQDSSRSPWAAGINSLGVAKNNLFEFLTIIGDRPDHLEAIGMLYADNYANIMGTQAILTVSFAKHLASYSRLIEAYSKLCLTKSSDRLIAVTRILEFLRPIIGDTVQGIPISHLPFSLAWDFPFSAKGYERNSGFPSWTWAGWNCHVSCSGLYLNDILVDTSSIYGSESPNDARRLLCEVKDSAIVPKEISGARPEAWLGTIKMLHFAAKTISSDQCWFRGGKTESDKVYLYNSDEFGDLDYSFKVEEMDKRKASCGFILLSHAISERNAFPFTALFVCWDGPLASRLSTCGFTENGFNSLNWVEKEVSLQ
ncbi:het-domain-containing protein [Fusarium pseudocircinatum]|uniref:Het-domain-containing protein n=1 Tax=Fusarium pseudocircinatum TaxID=56676 RepID=A0A8H5NUZ6_9HYPO|nr:het-domain-containing protein [Fusarium pseudocircinatum]